MNTTEKFATEIRIKTCEMLMNLGFGHLGASLSIVETLAVLYEDVMRVDPNNPKSMERDWFVLSKGHGGPSYYATLALKGYFDVDELMTLNHGGTNLPSHPDRNKTIGVDATTGSLGQGISQAVGIAKGLQIQGIDRNVYCIIGDGELNEGQVFEALIFAKNQNLSNFTVLLDDNKKQLDGLTREISMDLNYHRFFETLGYETYSVDGQSTDDIKEALEKEHTGPKAIVLDTIKCQGLPYFENLYDNHHLRFGDKEKEILQSEIERLRGSLNG